MTISTNDIRDRIRSRTTTDANGCWIWIGTIDKVTGYGRLSVQGQMRGAHVASHEAHVGPIPAGHEIDHLCRVRRCVNPAHLEAVTRQENARRVPGSFAAENAAKTHCPQGHPYDEVNTYVTPRGKRACRSCRRESSRLDMARRRAQAKAGAR